MPDKSRVLFIKNASETWASRTSLEYDHAPTLDTVEAVDDGLSLHLATPYDIIVISHHANPWIDGEKLKALRLCNPDCTIMVLEFLNLGNSTGKKLPSGIDVLKFDNDGAVFTGLITGILNLVLSQVQTRKYVAVLETEIEEKAAIRNQAESLAGIGSWVWDDVNDVMLWCSDQHARMHGLSHSEYMRTVTSLEGDASWTHPDDRERYKAEYDQAMREARELDTEYRIVSRSGEIIFVREVSEPLCDETGKVIRTFGTLQDITAMKLAELELLEAHDSLETKVLERTLELEKAKTIAEIANKTKSEFMSTINHELRTPLTSIKGSLGLLKATGTCDQNDTNKTLLDMAIRNSDTLAVLINDLLDFEKNMVGNLQIEMQPHDLINLVRDGIETSKGYAKTFSVDYVLEERVAEAMVNINEVKFKQIIMNLLSNAAKFSNPGEDVEISVFEESAVFCVSINDHGIGISASDQERIFDQFVQVDSSSTRLQPGTGLGLAITKSLIERMNGSIDVQSRPGMGSSFTVSFPQSPGTG